MLTKSTSCLRIDCLPIDPLGLPTRNLRRPHRRHLNSRFECRLVVLFDFLGRDGQNESVSLFHCNINPSENFPFFFYTKKNAKRNCFWLPACYDF